MKINYTDYLTELKLGDVLRELAKKCKFTVEAQWKVGNQRCDYALFRKKENIPFVVYEFEGFRHYNSFVTQQRDLKKQQRLEDLGIRLIKIPYFVQLRQDMLLSLFPFAAHLKSDVAFPHGFISRLALTPIDYNDYGLRLWCEQLQKLPRKVAMQIWLSATSNVDKSELVYWPKFVFLRFSGTAIDVDDAVCMKTHFI